MKEEPTEMPSAKQPKLNSLFIEAVNNGFILYENDQKGNPMNNPSYQSASIPERLVFNTKEQLNNYINENF